MISYYADVLPDGRVRGCFPYISPPPEGWAPQAEGEVVQLDAPIDWRGPTVTSVLYRIDGAFVWIEKAALEEAKANAWASVKAARDAAEAAPFEFDGGMYDPNKENISGAALAALLAQMSGQDVTRNWTLADNTVRSLSGAQIIGLGLALTARIDSLHQQGRLLRDRIEAAQTVAEAYAVTWPTEQEESNNGNQ